MIELAAFFGNPGKEYARNRHNAGFLLAEKLPFYADLQWQKKYRGSYAAIDRYRLTGGAPSQEGRLHFIKPETFMNLSGEAVSRAASFFKIKIEDVIVVHDELELPMGTISLKFGGGLGGHNGLRSMKASFGSADFWRLRLGIGRPDSRLPGEGGPPGSGEGIIDWVLSDFDAAEEETLNRVLEAGAALLLRAFVDGPESLLPEWAKKKLPDITE
ncbi:MAG: aminoacyl-tRNA hydrolase [Treponema sp.]|jgi:PTH1 family peptidyl-tRNA hydrolase|nr:aminoacyl-tRNA hydrolase [Treponema sp.]